jgi:hypothetical protein
MLAPELQDQMITQQQQMFDNIAAQLKKLNQSQAVEVPQTPVADVPRIEHDPFSFTEEEKKEFSDKPVGLIPSVKTAIDRGFHVFPLLPKDKITLPGSHGFKDSKPPADPSALSPWNENPDLNIGIDLGASDLCVLDFDKPEAIPAWLNEVKTYKVRTAKGVHVYFRGARKTTKLYVDGNLVGDVKSQGGYVLASGSVHPSGAVYTVIDDSPIVPVPDISSLIRHESEYVNASVDGPPIPFGSHDTELFRIGCTMRNANMNYQEIRDALINICQRRCENYGSDYVDMCEKKAASACKYPVGQAAPSVLLGGKPVGQPAQNPTEALPLDWRSQFRNLSEMEQGDIVMIIDGVLQEGTCFIGADPGHGKTLVALAFAKAITLGEPLFEVVPPLVEI